MNFLSRRKECLTTGRTLEELRRQEPQLRAAGFRKRRLCHGQSLNTGDFYQWWDRVGTRSYKTWKAAGLCIRCGGKPAISSRGKSQWCKEHLEEYRQYAKDYYHRKLKPLRANGK